MGMMEPEIPHLSRFTLARWLAGEAGPRGGEWEAHIQTCPRCARALAEAREAAADFTRRNPVLPRPRSAGSARGRRAHPFYSRWEAWWKAWAGLPAWKPALAALIIGVSTWLVRMHPAPVRESGWAAKGQATFYLYADGVRAVPSEDTLRLRGEDTLQLALTADRPVHYAIVEADDRDSLSVLMSSREGGPAGRPQGENLPHSLILSGAWRREQLFCVWSRRPFAPDAALRALRDLRAGRVPALPESLHLTTYRLARAS